MGKQEGTDYPKIRKSRVISNALLVKAFLPETKIRVDASCCAGVTEKSHRNALEAMKVYQIEVKNENK